MRGVGLALLLTALQESLCTWDIDTPFAAWDSQALAATQCLRVLLCCACEYVPCTCHAQTINLRLVSPRSHLGTSLLPGLYDQLSVVVPTSFLVRDGVHCN